MTLDPFRLGGMGSARKHNFGQGDAPLPEASADVTTAERSSIRQAAEGFFLAAENTMAEIMESLAAAINIENPDLNGFLSPAEALGQAVKEAVAVDTKVKNFVTKSAAAPYLEDNHKVAAEKISDLRSEIERAAATAPFETRDPIDADLSEEKLQIRTEHLPEIARDIDIMVVEAEAKGVDVLEPAESATRGKSDDGLMPIIGIGLMAAATWALYEALS